MTTFNDRYFREQELMRAYLEGARTFKRQTVIVNAATCIILTLLGVAIGLTAPVAYTLITAPPARGVMDVTR